MGLGDFAHIHGDGALWEQFDVYGTPAAVTVTKAGEVTKHTGQLTQEILTGAWT